MAKPIPKPKIRNLAVLLLSFCLSVLATLPISAQDTAGDTQTEKPTVKVLKQSIEVPNWAYVYLMKLEEDGVIEGLTNAEDWLFSCPDDQKFEYDDSRFRPTDTGIYTITYTHRVFTDISFSLEVIVKDGPDSFIDSKLGFLYVGASKTIVIPDSYMSLSEYEKIGEWLEEGETEPYFEVEIVGNEITLTGLKAGTSRLSFDHKYGSGYIFVNVAEKPTAEDIKVTEDPVVIPCGYDASLRILIGSGIVTGITGAWNDYNVVSSNTDVIANPTNKDYPWISANWNNTGHTTLTFSHKEFPEIKIYVNVEVKKGILKSIESQIGTIYIGESKTITISGDMPVSDFTFAPQRSEYLEGDFTFSLEGNQLTITGVAVGSAALNCYYTKTDDFTPVGFNVAEKPTAVPELADDEIYIPRNWSTNIFSLIRCGLVDMPNYEASNYIVESSDPSIIRIEGIQIVAMNTGQATLTFTHKDFDDLQFAVKANVVGFTLQGIKPTIREGESIEVLLPDGFPAGYVTYSMESDSYRPGEADMEWLSDNKVRITGISEGAVSFISDIKYFGRFYSGINVISKDATNLTEPEINEDGNGFIQTFKENPIEIKLPDNVMEAADDRPVKWRSSDIGVATVNENGVVTSSDLGLTVITAYVENPTSRAGETVLMTIDFWVTELETNIPATMKVGETVDLRAWINAGKDTDKYPTDKLSLAWRSLNTDLATISAGDDMSQLNAVAPGEVIIRVWCPVGLRYITLTIEKQGGHFTGIGGVEADGEEVFQPIYDLSGRLVARTPGQMSTLASGFYIRGGRKIFIRR